MLLGDLYTTCCKINTDVEVFFPHQNITTKQRSDENRDECCWVLIVLAEVAFRPISQAVFFSRGFGNADWQTYTLRLTVVCVRGVHNGVGQFFFTSEESFSIAESITLTT